MRAPIFSAQSKKVLDICSFSGENYGKLSNGQLLDSNNVSVLPGGALCSLLAERKINITAGAKTLADGVYTLSEEYDAGYETPVKAEWIYENVCPAEVMKYEDRYLTTSRIFIKNIGEYGKNENGYRRIVGSFGDGENIFVFYEACYIIMDERRDAEYSRLPKGYVVQFSTADGGSLCVYALSQLFMDVISSKGGITTSLIDARLMLHDSITNAKYQKSTLISTNGNTYKYASLDYAPSLGESYAWNLDKVYTELYKTLGDYPHTYFSYQERTSMIKYSNKETGDGIFESAGEKRLILPEMRLLTKSGGKWGISSEKADMPNFYAAVQYLDRLFGICDDTVYASVMGKCNDFKETLDETPVGSWRMVTPDEGGFTAITAYGGKVVVFTAERMMTIRGNELPFVLSYVGEHGCVSGGALAALDGLLYFVSHEGVMCYNGSSVKKISAPLPRTVDYSMAALTADCGMLVLTVYDGGLWFYEPVSGEWSRRIFDSSDVSFIGGSAIAKKENGCFAYRLFDDFGDFSFSVALANNGRRRIKSISVTANVGLDSELTLLDENGNALMCIYDTEDEIVTRTFLPRAFYADNGKIRFEGRGDCTLYGLHIEYVPLLLSTKRKG